MQKPELFSQNRYDFSRGCVVQAAGETLWLLPQKAIYWPDASEPSRNNQAMAGGTLILSDTHFGKAETFQQQGIPVPGKGTDDDLLRLHALISDLSVTRIIFLGDLFHSTENSSISKVMKAFDTWRDTHFRKPEMILVMGNHDIMHQETYHQLGLECVSTLQAGPFMMTHEPPAQDDQTYIAGHLHPSCRIRGRARQTVTLPCFRVRNNSIIMPAFGSFTGSHTLPDTPCDRFYMITSGSVISKEQ